MDINVPCQAEDEFEEAVEEQDEDLYNESVSADKTGQKNIVKIDAKEESVISKCWYTFFNNIQQCKSV